MAFGQLKSAALGLLLSCAAAAAPALAAPCSDTAAGFDVWLQDFRREAANLGISNATIQAALTGLSYDAKVIGADRNQKVFKQSFEQFSGRMIPPRVKRAKNMLEHARLGALAASRRNTACRRRWSSRSGGWRRTSAP